MNLLFLITSIIHFLFLIMTFLFVCNKIELLHLKLVESDAFTITWIVSGICTVFEVGIITMFSFEKQYPNTFYIILNIILITFFVASIFYTFNVSEAGVLWKFKVRICRLEEKIARIPHNVETDKIITDLRKELYELIHKEQDMLIKYAVSNAKRLKKEYIEQN